MGSGSRRGEGQMSTLRVRAEALGWSFADEEHRHRVRLRQGLTASSFTDGLPNRCASRTTDGPVRGDEPAEPSLAGR